ncbi:MAG: hypothetical protein ABJN42_29115 [Roseibium sp.]|uniref:hypothetical protein n=1 Tax=Roseibium sp. TaxID=1936156 RepID=UPI0032989F04
MAIKLTSKQHGFGLIEIILSVAITLSLLIGGILFYQQSQLASATSEAGRLVTSMTTEARSMFRMAQSFNTGQGLSTELMINAGSVPDKDVDHVEMVVALPYGGVLEVSAHPTEPVNNMLVSIVFPLTRDGRSMCNRLSATPQVDGAGPMGVGYRVENECDAAAPALFATFSRTGRTPPTLAR